MFKLKSSTNQLLKQLFLFIVLISGCLLTGTWLFANSSYFSRVGHFEEQPIAFSHELHTKDLGLDCTFCHTGVNHEANAGMPTMETCWGCHQDVLKHSDFLDPVRNSYLSEKPLKWKRVNLVADHVYFHHGKHIKAGVSCNACHGDAHEMPLMAQQQKFEMQFCLNCHKNAHEDYERPRSENQRLKDCYTCHR